MDSLTLNKNIFISFAKEDELWADQLINYIHDYGYNIEVECVTKDKHNDDTELVLSKYLLCIFILSHEYIECGSHFQQHCNAINNNIQSDGLKSLLNTTKCLIVNIDECNIQNEILHNKVRVVKWQPNDELLFWKQITNIFASMKKKELIRNALNLNSFDSFTKDIHKKKPSLAEDSNDLKTNITDDKITNPSHNIENLHLCQQTNSFDIKDRTNFENEPNNGNTETNTTNPLNIENDSDNTNDVSTSWNYENYNKVYPHLLSDSFTAEDEDLTKSDIENLTMRVEDIETLLAIPLSRATTTTSSPKKCKPSKYHTFSSQHEQMELLDILQTIHDKFITKIEQCRDVMKKKSYRRLLKRCDDCIVLTVNGKKHQQESDRLLNIFSHANMLSDDYFKCCCCNTMFHSERALQMHLYLCVKTAWIDLMKHS